MIKVNLEEDQPLDGTKSEVASLHGLCRMEQEGSDRSFPNLPIFNLPLRYCIDAPLATFV